MEWPHKFSITKDKRRPPQLVAVQGKSEQQTEAYMLIHRRSSGDFNEVMWPEVIFKLVALPTSRILRCGGLR